MENSLGRYTLGYQNSYINWSHSSHLEDPNTDHPVVIKYDTPCPQFVQILKKNKKYITNHLHLFADT